MNPLTNRESHEKGDIGEIERNKNHFPRMAKHPEKRVPFVCKSELVEGTVVGIDEAGARKRYRCLRGALRRKELYRKNRHKKPWFT